LGLTLFSLGVDTKGRGIPLIARTQQYIEAMIDGTSPRHPVIIVDDGQRLENDSLWDLSSLLFQAAKPSSAAASLLLVGDETLARRLELHILNPIRSRLTGIIKTQYLDEYESRLFIEHRLKNAAARKISSKRTPSWAAGRPGKKIFFIARKYHKSIEYKSKETRNGATGQKVFFLSCKTTQSLSSMPTTEEILNSRFIHDPLQVISLIAAAQVTFIT
jgi:hypothetical protein